MLSGSLLKNVAELLRRRTFVLSVLSLLFVAGCGEAKFGMPGAVALKGTLTDGGTPLFVEGIENATGMIVVEFHAVIEGEPEPAAVTSATVDLDGNFEIPQGIEPGEYVITVRQWEPYPQNDLLKDKFRFGKSNIKRTIDGDATLDIDLSKPEG